MLTYSRNIFETADPVDAIFRAFNAPASAATGLPIRVREADDGYIAEAVIPGVTSEAIEITVNGPRLTIAVNAQSQDHALENREAHSHSRVVASRTITLPREVDQAAIEASLDLGVLTLRLPKAASALPRRINVNSAPAAE